MALSRNERAPGFEAFERTAASLFGTRDAVVVGSARAGLAAALSHAGCKAGDEIVIPSYTAPCIPALLRHLGYRIRIAPVCPRRLVVTGETLAATTRPTTRAVLPTHTEGVTAPMAEIKHSLKTDLVIIEDAAHALGAQADGQPLGSYSHAAVHSFGKGKHLNTMFGGLVVTQDPSLADFLRAARATAEPRSKAQLIKDVLIERAIEVATHPCFYPWTLHPLIRAFDKIGIDLPTRLFEDDGRSQPGASFRRPPAAWEPIALRQLARFSSARDERRKVATQLRQELANRGLRYQESNGPGDHPLFVTLFHPERDRLRRALLAEGQDTQSTWMRAISDDEGRRDPVAERAEQEGLYLPVHPAVDPAAILAALDRARARIAA